MPFNYNGNTVNGVTYNGNTVNKVNYNGVTVWEAGPPVMHTVTITKTGTGVSNAWFDYNGVRYDETTLTTVEIPHGALIEFGFSDESNINLVELNMTGTGAVPTIISSIDTNKTFPILEDIEINFLFGENSSYINILTNNYKVFIHDTNFMDGTGTVTGLNQRLYKDGDTLIVNAVPDSHNLYAYSALSGIITAYYFGDLNSRNPRNLVITEESEGGNVRYYNVYLQDTPVPEGKYRMYLSKTVGNTKITYNGVDYTAEDKYVDINIGDSITFWMYGLCIDDTKVVSKSQNLTSYNYTPTNSMHIVLTGINTESKAYTISSDD